MEVVFIDKFLLENPFLKVHVFEVIELSSEIEIFEVDAKEAATRVDMTLLKSVFALVMSAFGV